MALLVGDFSCVVVFVVLACVKLDIVCRLMVRGK